jgi:hypothetical protein
MCAVLNGADLGSVVGAPVAAIPQDTSPTRCAYHAAASPVPFDVVLRQEDAFASMDEVLTAFPGGTMGAAPADVYWVGDVATGWFIAGGKLYAVQVLGDLDSPTASDIASSVANLVLPRL